MNLEEIIYKKIISRTFICEFCGWVSGYIPHTPITSFPTHCSKAMIYAEIETITKLRTVILRHSDTLKENNL